METLILNLPTLPLFFSLFCLIYLTAYFILFRTWSPKHRPDAASCFISLAHGTPAALLAFLAILSQPSNGFAAPNTPFQNIVLEFSIAYFTVDLIHLAILDRDYLFIAHHLATLFVFVTCRFVALHGAFALLVLLVLAEVTSFCQNVWTLAGIRRNDLPIADRIYSFLSAPFYSLYTLMRVILGPLFFCKMSIFYLSGQAASVIPTWVSVSWIVVVGGAIAVSILWIWNRWLEFFAERSRSGEKKER